MATSIRSRQSPSRSSWRSPGDHDAEEAVHWLGAAGWTAKGVLYLLIGVIALQVAFGASTTQQASKDGALQKLVQQPAGSFFLGLVTIGLLAYAAYRLLTILFDDAQGPELLAHSAARIGSAAVYLLAALQGILLLVATSAAPSDSNEAPKTWSATLLDSTAGTVLLVAVSVGILGFAGYQLYVGFSKRFMDNLSCPAGSKSSETTIVSIGTIGIVARAAVAGLVGAFLLQAVITHDPNQAEGLDGSLRELQRTVFGPAVLAVVAAGLATYGVFCFFSARMRHHADG
jgi:hypothetical protein